MVFVLRVFLIAVDGAVGGWLAGFPLDPNGGFLLAAQVTKIPFVHDVEEGRKLVAVLVITVHAVGNGNKVNAVLPEEYLCVKAGLQIVTPRPAHILDNDMGIYPMMVTVVVNILNIIGNYSLIFGRFGFPELGVEGAAISTAFSRGVSMIILFVILFRKHIHRFPPAYFRPFPWIELKNLMKVGLPSAGEQLSYSSSQVVITYFINMLGVEALATRTYCVNIIMFAYLFSISMAQGGAICIGHLIGEKKPHAAFLMGKYVMKKSVMITVMLSCILALSGHAIFGWLTSNPDIIRMGATILIIDVLLEIGRPINIFATNALRAAGDVNYPFYVGLVVQWSVAVGVGYLFGFPFGWGICGMWVAFLLDENIRGFIFVRRWYGMKWVNKSFIRS